MQKGSISWSPCSIFVLGFLLVVHIQHQRHGESSDKTRGKPGKFHCPFCSWIETKLEISMSNQSKREQPLTMLSGIFLWLWRQDTSWSLLDGRFTGHHSFLKKAAFSFQVGVFAKRFHFTGLVRDAPKLSLPGKLVFPRFAAWIIWYWDQVFDGLWNSCQKREKIFKTVRLKTDQSFESPAVDIVDRGLNPLPRLIHSNACAARRWSTSLFLSVCTTAGTFPCLVWVILWVPSLTLNRCWNLEVHALILLFNWMSLHLNALQML